MRSLCAFDKVIVHQHSLQLDQEVTVLAKQRDPGRLTLNEVAAIVPSYLEVATILAKTQSEHQPLDQAFLMHDLVDGRELV